MNKKFFAALASATMAFSATGSLAVFAQDFEDEVAPVLPGTPGETTATVAWNEDNFGDLAKKIQLTTTGTPATTTLNATVFKIDTSGTTITVTDGKVNTADLAKVTEIALNAAGDYEIKGLEYFTGLTKLNAVTTTGIKLTNTSLDFSANTSLTNISIKSAPELRNIQLPVEDEDGNKSYNLKTLELHDSKLLSIDLTEQTDLTSIKMTGGMLQDIQLPRNAKCESLLYV